MKGYACPPPPPPIPPPPTSWAENTINTEWAHESGQWTSLVYCMWSLVCELHHNGDCAYQYIINKHNKCYKCVILVSQLLLQEIINFFMLRTILVFKWGESLFEANHMKTLVLTTATHWALFSHVLSRIHATLCTILRRRLNTVAVPFKLSFHRCLR